MKIALIGYGKMGKEIEATALQRGHSVVLKINSGNADALTTAQLKLADVAIEFSKPGLAVSHIMTCFEAGIPVVVGTTGWYEKLNDVKQIASQQNQSFLYASNFSIGVNLFFQINRQVAALMANQSAYHLKLQEIHHLQKLDAPSGTAITLAEGVMQENSRKQKWVNHASNQDHELGIESLRMEGVPGTHRIAYESEIDSIELIHTAHNRKGFALGAVMAAEWLQGKTGCFEMKDVLGNI